MARPRKPTAELELNGAFRKDPQRRRVDPPTAGPLGDPPPCLPEACHAMWYELSEIAPLGVLRASDRWLVETAVRLMWAQRYDEKFSVSKLTQLNWCMSRMGMTPSDRSKVHAPKEKAASPFSKFAAKIKDARKEPPVH